MNEHNPYSASRAVVDRELPRLDIDSAPKVRRFFNWLIDRFVIMGIAFALGMAVAMSGNQAAIQWLGNVDRLTDILITTLMLVMYYTAMEGVFGFTIGKLITNTRVVDEYGRPPGFRRAFFRSLCRLIPFNALSLLISDDQVRRGWHDSIPKTYVILRPRPGTPVGRPRHSISRQFGEHVGVPVPEKDGAGL